MLYETTDLGILPLLFFLFLSQLCFFVVILTKEYIIMCVCHDFQYIGPSTVCGQLISWNEIFPESLASRVSCFSLFILHTRAKSIFL